MQAMEMTLRVPSGVRREVGGITAASLSCVFGLEWARDVHPAIAPPALDHRACAQPLDKRVAVHLLPTLGSRFSPLRYRPDSPRIKLRQKIDELTPDMHGVIDGAIHSADVVGLGQHKALRAQDAAQSTIQ